MKRESPFKNIPSQFELIPDGVPVAFISYSWDSKEHKDWVLKLSADLREKFRVYTLNGSLKFEITAKRLYAASQRVL